MPLTFKDVISELNTAMPDSYVREQATQTTPDEGSNELLAKYVANLAQTLFDPSSTDGANLEAHRR